MSKTFFYVLLVLATFVSCDSAKILIIVPSPFISHQKFFQLITSELLQRGNELTIITADPVFLKDKAHKNVTEIDIHDVAYNLWKEHIKLDVAHSFYSLLNLNLKTVTKLAGLVLKNEDAKALINDSSTKFDLIIMECWVEPFIAFSHFFNAPIIKIASMSPIINHYDFAGVPVHPIIYPACTNIRQSNFSETDKVLEIFNHFLLLSVRKMQSYDTILKEVLYPNTSIPTVEELNKNVDMLFSNIHPLWEFTRPIPLTALNIGGLESFAPKNNMQNLEQFLNSSTYGVIYISFGTTMNSKWLPQDKIEVLVKTLSQLPYDVLWKWDNDELPGCGNDCRIKFGKWFPQADLLKHPKLKLFVTQGGSHSTDEAINAGVPLIGMPLIVDQFKNTENYVKHGIGQQLNILTVTEEVFKNAVVSVITDKRYRQNMLKLRTLLHDQPQTAMERAMWWIDYAIRHGGTKHLRAPGTHMPLTEYLELDLFFIVLIILMCILLVIILILRFVFKAIMSNFKFCVKDKIC